MKFCFMDAQDKMDPWIFFLVGETERVAVSVPILPCYPIDLLNWLWNVKKYECCFCISSPSSRCKKPGSGPSTSEKFRETRHWTWSGFFQQVIQLLLLYVSLTSFIHLNFNNLLCIYATEILISNISIKQQKKNLIYFFHCLQ